MEQQKSSNIKSLKRCPVCNRREVFASEYTIEGCIRYRYECKLCGQYFVFKCASQLTADTMFNRIMEVGKAEPEE